MARKLVVSFEGVFYQVLGLSLFFQSKTNRNIFQPIPLKAFSLSFSLALLGAYILLNIGLNMIPNLQLMPLREILNGHIDTMLGAATLNWFVDVTSGSILYLAAICTENDFIRILNRVNQIRVDLPRNVLKKSSQTVAIGMTMSVTLIVLAFLTNLPTFENIWAVLYIFGCYVIEVISARQLSSIYLIFATTSEVHFTITSCNSVTTNKKLYYRLVEDISELLATFQRSNHIQILVLSTRVLMTDITMIYSTCFLFSKSLLQELVVPFLFNVLAIAMVNLKFIILTYYCERAVDEFHSTMKSLQSRREQEGDFDKMHLHCLHNSTTSITSFGLFSVDRKFANLVSVYGYCISKN